MCVNANMHLIFWMKHVYLVANPLAFLWILTSKFSKDSGGDLVDAEKYRHLIGRLIYLQIIRPDITFAVNKLSKFSCAPRKFHQQAVHNILH